MSPNEDHPWIYLPPKITNIDKARLVLSLMQNISIVDRATLTRSALDELAPRVHEAVDFFERQANELRICFSSAVARHDLDHFCEILAEYEEAHVRSRNK